MGRCDKCGGLIGWDGWGTALKPAHEPIVLARKPLVGTVAANVAEFGCGALNIDGCRVGTEQTVTRHTRSDGAHRDRWEGNTPTGETSLNAGRWPANLIHDGSDEVVAGFPESGTGNGPRTAVRGGHKFGGDKGQNETLVGRWHGDSGSAARFFYCAKSSKADRDAGCDGLDEKPSYMVENGSKTAGRNGVRYDRNTTQRNNHPTVKPTDLMRYLCRLVTPPGGTVLDPFTGSGSTGRGAILEGFNFIGIEREAEYADIARRRCREAEESVSLLSGATI